MHQNICHYKDETPIYTTNEVNQPNCGTCGKFYRKDEKGFCR